MSAAFERGDRFVLGWWDRTPFGPLVDLMWARPDGTRVLLTRQEVVRRFLRTHYRFDHALAEPVQVTRSGAVIRVGAGPVRIELRVGRRGPTGWVLRARPGLLRRSAGWLDAEDRLLRRLAGSVVGGMEEVRTTGRTSVGAEERYAVADLHPLVAGYAEVDGMDLGPLTSFAPARFGFSEPPSEPCLVHVATTICP